MSLETRVFIGLGGNVGDVIATMSSALQKLDEHSGISVTAASQVYKTPPWGVEDQDWFFNACAELSCSLSPQELLEICLATEKEFGRERRLRWGPRTLDIDILIFGDLELESEVLALPHPRMTERAFVLVPLLEIAPDILVDGKLVKEALENLETEEIYNTEQKIL